MAANANHREKIVEEGGISSLVSLACCEDVNAQRQALAALRGLCISPEYRPIVVREGILDPLVLMSRFVHLCGITDLFITYVAVIC